MFGPRFKPAALAEHLFDPSRLDEITQMVRQRESTNGLYAPRTGRVGIPAIQHARNVPHYEPPTDPNIRDVTLLRQHWGHDVPGLRG